MTDTTDRDIRQGRIARRAQRLQNPREPRVGKIKIGRLIKRCRSCKHISHASVDTCPKCSGRDFGNTYPEKANHYIFYDDAGKDEKGRPIPSMGHHAYDKSPTVLNFTFKAPPTECVMLRRECYQGGKLFCCNQFQVDHDSGVYTDTGVAHRHGHDIACDPETCPYSIGGTVTGPDKKSKTIRPGQCGETVTARLWLPDVPGFASYEHKSGSIETINNFQTAVRDILAMTRSTGGHLPLKLELKLKKVNSSYPDENGQPVKTEFFTSVIHFPFSMTALMEKGRHGQLSPGDVMYVLPAGIASPALPGPNQGNYDELVDGPRSLPAAPTQDAPATEIADLKGRATPPSTQADDGPGEELAGLIQDLFKTWTAGLTPYERGKRRKLLCKTFGLETNRKGAPKLGSVTPHKASRIIDWLNVKLEGPDGLETDDTSDLT
jgi:hypothetical protein